jgi:hypothetical protein
LGLRVYVTGTGSTEASITLKAYVGSIPIDGIFLYPDGSGLASYPASTPSDGAALAFGYVQLTLTDLVFDLGSVA